VRSEGDFHVLDLHPLKGAEQSYGRLRVHIHRTRHTLERIEYFDAAGTHLKTQIREDYRTVKGNDQLPAIAHKVTMRTLKTGHETVNYLKDVRANTGLKDRIFSRRELVRPF
jgi:hypothetical protein